MGRNVSFVLQISLKSRFKFYYHFELQKTSFIQNAQKTYFDQYRQRRVTHRGVEVSTSCTCSRGDMTLGNEPLGDVTIMGEVAVVTGSVNGDLTCVVCSRPTRLINVLTGGDTWCIDLIRSLTFVRSRSSIATFILCCCRAAFRI